MNIEMNVYLIFESGLLFYQQPFAKQIFLHLSWTLGVAFLVFLKLFHLDVYYQSLVMKKTAWSKIGFTMQAGEYLLGTSITINYSHSCAMHALVLPSKALGSNRVGSSSVSTMSVACFCCLISSGELISGVLFPKFLFPLFCNMLRTSMFFKF